MSDAEGARFRYRKGALVAGGALVPALIALLAFTGGDGTPQRRLPGDGRAVFQLAAGVQAGYRSPGEAYAGRSDVFGLVTPVEPAGRGGAGEVRFAPARRDRPGGPETLVPDDVGAYGPLAVAPGAEIRVTAPIAEDGVTDYIRGIQVTPERFGSLYRAAEQRYGPFIDRAHMFELWFDDQGRITRMLHYFSP